MNVKQDRSTLVFSLLAVTTAIFSIFSAVLMTEPGQSLNLPRSWTVAYFEYRWLLVVLNLALLGCLWLLHVRRGIWRRSWMIAATAGVLACIIAANFLLAALFPPYQYGASYLPVAEADALLQDDDVIYAVEINGESRGYPRKHLEIPHVAGAEIGGEQVVMTFCALSNLPVVYDQNFAGGRSDLGILLQTHNNLLMVDKRSGELVQQITGRTEFSGEKLKSYPNTMMSWASFKQLYPESLVFVYQFDRVLDSVLLKAFAGPMERQFSEEHGPVFPTLTLQDHRLGAKEQIWGLDAGGQQAAFTRAFLQANPVFPFELAGEQYLIVYDTRFDVVSLYERKVNGRVVDVQSIDVNGQSEAGKLRRVPLHNGVFWMVWSHWYPETRVFS